MHQFARGYGFSLGDPAPHPSRRKMAASGPKNKAKVKKQKRAAKATKGQSLITGPNPKLNLHKLITGGAQLVGQSGIVDALNAAHLKDFPGSGKGMGGARHHRRINPANVRALRRASSRLLQFERLVHRTRKSLRGLGSIIAPHHRAPMKRGRK